MRPIPKYINIANELKQEIQQLYNIDQQILSENSLSERYQTTRVTIRKALNILIQEDILYVKQGLGYFVKNKNNLNNTFNIGFFDNFIMNAKNNQATHKSKVILFKIIHANSALAKILKIKVHSKIIHVKRVRYLDNEPAILENSYMVYKLFPNLKDSDLNDGSKLKYISNLYDLGSSYRTILPELSDINTAIHLRIPEYTLIFKVNVTNHLKNNTIFEYSELFYNLDKYNFEYVINMAR